MPNPLRAEHEKGPPLACGFSSFNHLHNCLLRNRWWNARTIRGGTKPGSTGAVGAKELAGRICPGGYSALGPLSLGSVERSEQTRTRIVQPESWFPSNPELDRD